MRTTNWDITHEGGTGRTIENVPTHDIDRQIVRLFKAWIRDRKDEYYMDDDDQETIDSYTDTDSGWDNFQCDLSITPTTFSGTRINVMTKQDW